MTLHPVGLVWLCTVDSRQQKVVLKRKLLRAGHWSKPGTGEVKGLCPVELRMWQQHEMMSSHQRPLADFYPQENFRSKIGICLWCHNDGAWLQGADGEPCQKPCWNPAKLHQLLVVCPVQLRGHVQSWWADSHKISSSWSHAGSRSESCCSPETS